MRIVNLPIRLKNSVLSFGSQTKNTICFAEGLKAELSEPLGDLSYLADFKEFNRRIKLFLKRAPKVLAYDLHPEYQSSRLVHSVLPKGGRVYSVQHHYAHLASCMAEGGIRSGKVIGVACDGTGMGDGNKLWGFEFFLLDYKRYLRLGHLKYIPLIGGEAAIREPYRVAFAWLYSIFGDRFMRLKLGLVKKINKSQWNIFKVMLNRGMNCPLSSSCGRLFDAVSALLGLKYRIESEAEAAIALEDIALTYNSAVLGYGFNILKTDSKFLIDPAPMFREIIDDLRSEKPKGLIARKFHFTVADMILKVSRRIRRDTGIKSIVLSGGVFQNKILSDDARCLLRDTGFEVVTHKILQPNDSCISLGQAVIAGMK